MYEQINNKFSRKMITLTPGEYYATKDDIVLATLLGSCVAACLFDSEKNIIGMNHFLLVGDQKKNDNYLLSDSGRYGINAMELLINQMMKLGADRKNIKAKSFGGAHVLDSLQNSFTDIPETNVKFIKEFLKIEKIELLTSDLGGLVGRKILFFNSTFKVLLKKLDSSTAFSTQNEELDFLAKERLKMEKILKEGGLKNSKQPGAVDFFS